LQFAYAGGGLGKGGLGTLFVNDKKVVEGPIERTQPMLFSADQTADVGSDDAMPVTEDYERGDNEFTGKIHNVTIEVGKIVEGTKAEAAKDGAEAWKKAALAN
jgi:arylsulfatase